MDSFVTWLAQKLTLLTVTMWAIQFVSTIPERMLLLILCSLIMATILAITYCVRPARVRPFMHVIGAFLLFRGLYLIFPRDYSGDIALFLALLIAIIYFPGWRPSTSTPPNVPRLGVGRLVFSTILVPALAVFLLDGWTLQRLAQALHRDKSVHKLDSIQLNSLALDAQHRLLYASGHGTEYLLAYDIDDLTHAPRSS